MNEEFERWYREAYAESDGSHPLMILEGGGYADPIDQIAFETWLSCSGEILVNPNSDYQSDYMRERLRSAVSKDAEKWREHCHKLNQREQS